MRRRSRCLSRRVGFVMGWTPKENGCDRCGRGDGGEDEEVKGKGYQGGKGEREMRAGGREGGRKSD